MVAMFLASGAGETGSGGLVSISSDNGISTGGNLCEYSRKWIHNCQWL